MKKKVLNLFCLMSLAIGTHSVLASIIPVKKTAMHEGTISCDAPPPNNLHISSRGPEFITLNWAPTHVNATHTLTVYIKSEGLDWELFNIFQDISGGNITINDIGFDMEGRFELATNCETGEAGPPVALKMDKIILDLDVNGRIPAQPQAISCENIHFNQYEWIGFQVERPGGEGAEFNQFEVRVLPPVNGGQHVEIRRVFDNTVIYAADKELNYPPPKLKWEPKGQIIKKIGNNIPDLIGLIKIQLKYDEGLIDFCNLNWDNAYIFTPLKTNSIIKKDNGSAQGIAILNTNSNIHLEYTFEENLSLVTESLEHDNPSTLLSVSLININGNIINEQQINGKFDLHQIEMLHIPKGIYFMRVRADNMVKTLKISKIN